MQYLTGQQVLDTAMSLSTDQTATMRSKMAIWMSMVGIDLTSRRKWNFLRTSQDITASNNAITLPTDYLEFADMTFSDGGTYAFIETATTYTFEPEVADGTVVTLTYIASLPEILDNATSTILPYYCKNALVLGMLSYLYAFDREDNYAQYPSIYENEINKLKVLDNRSNSIPSYDDIGFPVRTVFNGTGVV